MRLPFAFAALLVSSSLASADVKVMASIKPIHSLVASVMQGAGTPGLIVGGSNSPHSYALKPSDAAALQQADVIFWVGNELEAFLEKPLEALGQKAEVISLLEADGMKTLGRRDGNGFEAHDHEAGARHDRQDMEGHVWLDPDNAKAMVTMIAATLASADPGNAALYKGNADKAASRLDKLSREISDSIAPARGKGFIVFHDAYHYYEDRFGITAAGAIAINPENPPGARAIAEIRQRILDGKVSCIFAEPQFDNKLVAIITEGSTVKSAMLDPVGAALEPGPALYELLLRDITRSLVQCLL